MVTCVDIVYEYPAGKSASAEGGVADVMTDTCTLSTGTMW